MANSKPVMGMYDAPMWRSIENHQLALQCCDSCQRFRYPPASLCPYCLAENANWTTLQGTGTIQSWVVFHRQYFDDYPPPYNSIAVRLDEGPLIVTCLKGPQPEGSWIGHRIALAYAEHAGRIQHYAVLLDTD